MAVENSKVLIIVNNWGIEETELTRPLRDVAAIERRLGAVEALTKNTVAREELILSLSGISDMERLIGRIAYGTAGGRAFASLRNSIERITEVKAQLTAFTRHAHRRGAEHPRHARR